MLQSNSEADHLAMAFDFVQGVRKARRSLPRKKQEEMMIDLLLPIATYNEFVRLHRELELNKEFCYSVKFTSYGSKCPRVAAVRCFGRL